MKRLSIGNKSAEKTVQKGIKVISRTGKEVVVGVKRSHGAILVVPTSTTTKIAPKSRRKRKKRKRRRRIW